MISFARSFMVCDHFRSGIHQAMTEAMNSVESLASCSSGYWIIAPLSGDGYPVFGVRKNNRDIRRKEIRGIFDISGFLIFYLVILSNRYF